MKTALVDYFSQSPKGITSDGASPLSKGKDTSKNLVRNERSNSSHSEDPSLNDKKNSKKKKIGKDKKLTDSAGESPNDSNQKKRTQKKKSLSTKRVINELQNLDKDGVSDRKGIRNEDCQSLGFPLKIKIKSKQVDDSENFIEEFSSPERVDNEMKSSDLKSPQGTLLQYFTSHKKVSPPAQKEIDLKGKLNKDITDFFISSKHEEASPLSSLKMDNSGAMKEVAYDSKMTEKCSSKSKNVKKTTKKSPSLAAKRKESKDIAMSAPMAENSKELKDESGKTGSRSRVKSKPVKRSLSLPKSEVSTKILSNQIEEKQLGNGNEPSKPSTVVESMSSALKNILSKSNFGKASDAKSTLDEECASITSKKRKRNKDDDSKNLVRDKPSKNDCDESPVKSRKRMSKNNFIGCDSDDETSRKLIEQKPIEPTSNAVINHDSLICGLDDTSKAEDSKRNSLMNYFSKVSKEELLAKEEKVEYKVQALVHSPPTTPSKKSKRRSINSLPGGTSSLSSKKGNVMKAKLKENLNAIDVVIVDEPKGPDMTCKDQVLLQASGSKLVSATKLSTKSQKIRTSPRKKICDSTNSKAGHLENNTAENARLVMELSQSVSSENSTKAVKCVTVINEDSLAIPLTVPHEKLRSDSPSDTRLGWKLRVCLTPVSLPTTQGTLLEEESDCDEIFLSRRKKKRKLSKQSNCIVSNGDETQVLIVSEHRQSLSPDVVFEKETGPTMKIAPLFTRKAEIQARQQFLQSGVPDQIKRVLETQLSLEEQEADIFPNISHIQQIDVQDWIWNLCPVDLHVKNEDTSNISVMPINFSLKEMTGCCNIREEVADIMNASCKGPEMRTVYGLPMNIVKPILRSIKKECPDFKVVSTFKTLRSKMREEEIAKAAALSVASESQRPRRKSSNRKSLNSKDSFNLPKYRAQVWTEKYRPVSASEIVGNNESVQQLKRWLEVWRKASEDTCKQNIKDDIKYKKKRKDLIDDDEDFLVSDNSSEGGHSNLPIGVAVLCGPNGSGKTCSVYALAKDLGYKVLEVNASEKRNGKLVLSKLAEATQSHQVQQSKNAEQGFAALFGSNLKTSKNNKQKSKATPKQKSTATPRSDQETDDEKAKKMSLILFEDVDVVFDEEDEGFLSAISSLVSTSKRPVILTTTDPESPTISRFMNSASLILEYSCPWNMLSTWLQIASVLEGVYAAPDAIKDLVLLCKGDFRRALLQMQLWVTSGGNNLPMPSLMFLQTGHKSKKGAKSGGIINDSDLDDMNDEETTSSEDMDSMPAIPANSDCISPMLGSNIIEQSNEVSKDSKKNSLCIKIPVPLNLGSYWWNIPPLLCLKQIEHAPLPVVKETVSNSGTRKMLDDSFIASFCTEDGDMNDYGAKEDSNATCSQGTTEAEIQKEESTAPNVQKSDDGSFAYRSCCSLKEMFAVTSQMFCMSSVDIISAPYQLDNPSNMEPLSRFPHAVLKDSLSLIKFEEENSSHLSKSITEEICHWLAEQSLMETRNSLGVEDSCLNSCYNPCLPNEDEIRWRDAQVETERAALAAIPLSMYVERRAVSTDYVPTLRTLCRLERNRSIINTKRRNRFYHYLRSTGAILTDTQLEILCQTMNA